MGIIGFFFIFLGCEENKDFGFKHTKFEMAFRHPKNLRLSNVE